MADPMSLIDRMPKWLVGLILAVCGGLLLAGAQLGVYLNEPPAESPVNLIEVQLPTLGGE